MLVGNQDASGGHRSTSTTLQSKAAATACSGKSTVQHQAVNAWLSRRAASVRVRLKRTHNRVMAEWVALQEMYPAEGVPRPVFRIVRQRELSFGHRTPV